MRKLAGFLHWKDENRAAENFINLYGWKMENGGVFYQSLSLLLKVFCWSCLHSLVLCHLPPPKWGVKLVPPLISLSPPFPLHVGMESFLLLEFTVKWAHIQSQPRSLELSISVSQGVFICFYFLYSRFSLSTLVLLFSAISVIPFLSAPSGPFFSFPFSTCILFILSHFIRSAQNADLQCLSLILPDQSTVPSCHLNKGNPGHTDIGCKSSCKHGYGKYWEQNKQQWQWGQSEVVSFFNSSVTFF